MPPESTDTDRVIVRLSARERALLEAIRREEDRDGKRTPTVSDVVRDAIRFYLESTHGAGGNPSLRDVNGRGAPVVPEWVANRRLEEVTA